MDFSFFTTDNKSGYKTNEKWLKKNQPEIHEKIIKYSTNLIPNGSFKEKIYFFFHKLESRPKCIKCQKEIKFRERFDKPYGEFCTLECANNSKEELVKRMKKTINEKYGVDYYPQHKDFIKKQKETKFIKYGDETYNNYNKSKVTKLSKYGDEKFNNIKKYKKTCIERYLVDNYSKSISYKDKKIKDYLDLYKNIPIKEVKKFTVIINCPDCGKNCEITKQLLYERNIRNYNVCTNCNPIGIFQKSGLEKEIADFISDLGVKVELGFKIPNTKYEIDVYLPDHNLGIELNGVYWHNELYKTSNYHLKKTILCEENRIKLLHIFEDEWLYKKEIIKSIIKNRLKIINNSVFARKCVIKEVTSKESCNFLEKNHIQGKVKSKIRLGLYYNDKLISLMTFSRGRVIMGGKKDEWELTRFCNLLNTNVVGSASKLLNFFLKNYKPLKIVSYSDIRLFDGNLYEKLGFKYISQSKPNYWYVKDDRRYYRFNFNKKSLIKEGYDPNKTEKEIMFERKIYRIYDCGNKRWELT